MTSTLGAAITMGITGTESGRPSESASENTPELNTPQDGEFDASIREYLVQFGDMAAVSSIS